MAVERHRLPPDKVIAKILPREELPPQRRSPSTWRWPEDVLNTCLFWRLP